jgi:hypothetical protein
MRAALLLTALAVLGACTTPQQGSRYTAELDRLEADCRTRGGVLTPTGATTGRVETEFACRITAASRIPR